MDNPHQVAPPQDLPQITHDDFTDHANAAKSKPTSSGALKGNIIPPHHNSKNKLGSEVLTIKHNSRVTEVSNNENGNKKLDNNMKPPTIVKQMSLKLPSDKDNRILRKK